MSSVAKADCPTITAAQAAELLGCDEKTIEDLFRTGELPGTKIGRSWITLRDVLLDDLATRMRTEAAARRARTTQPTDPAPAAAPAATPRPGRGARRRPAPSLAT